MFGKLQDKRNKHKSQYHLGQLVRTADTKSVYRMESSTIWSYKLYTLTQILHDKIPSDRIGYLPERYNGNK